MIDCNTTEAAEPLGGIDWAHAERVHGTKRVDRVADRILDAIDADDAADAGEGDDASRLNPNDDGDWYAQM